MGSFSTSGIYIPAYDEEDYQISYGLGVTNLETALAARLILRAVASDAAANLQSGSAGLTGTFLPALLGVGLGAGTLPGAGVTAELRGTGTQARLSYDETNRLDVSVNSSGDATLDASGDDLTLPDRVAFTHASAPIISAKAGPSATQQHAIPAVASDTFALVAAAQTFTNKTLTSPTVNTPTISGGTINNTVIGGTTAAAGTFTTLTAGTSVTTPLLAATGNLTVNPAGGSVLPPLPYSVALGALTTRFLALYAAELNVSTLVAAQVLATVGGRVLVGPTTQLVAALTNVATTIDVKHNNLASGDRLYLEGNGNVEWLAVTSTSTPITGGYRYSVTRNLDGTGANAWAAGDAVFNSGTTGSGWIDLYASTTGGTSGPAIVVNRRSGTAYNAYAPVAAMGNLNTLYGYGSTTYGFAAGDYASGNYLTSDPTNGLQIVGGSGNVALTSTGLVINAPANKANPSTITWKSGTTDVAYLYATYVETPATRAFVSLGSGLQPAWATTQLYAQCYDTGPHLAIFVLQSKTDAQWALLDGVSGLTVGSSSVTAVARLHAYGVVSEHLRLDCGGGKYTAFVNDVSGNLTVTPTGGVANVAGRITSTVTTEQMRLAYDATHYTSFTVDSGGGLTVAAKSGTDVYVTNRTWFTLSSGSAQLVFAYDGANYGYLLAGATGNVTLAASGGTTAVAGKFYCTGNAGFNGVTPIAKPTVTGSRGGNAALASLLTALASYGLITDSTS